MQGMIFCFVLFCFASFKELYVCVCTEIFQKDSERISSFNSGEWKQERKALPLLTYLYLNVTGKCVTFIIEKEKKRMFTLSSDAHPTFLTLLYPCLNYISINQIHSLPTGISLAPAFLFTFAHVFSTPRGTSLPFRSLFSPLPLAVLVPTWAPLN